MAASAANWSERNASPGFHPRHRRAAAPPAWRACVAQTEDIRQACARVLGFDPDLRLATIDDLRIEPGRETFVIPVALDFSLCQRESLGQVLAEARRHPETAVHHDDVDCGHPLVVGALADQIGRAIEATGAPPQRCGLVLAASGHGDPASRAQSYRLSRLLWEQLGLAQAEVGFIRHPSPFLGSVLEKCAHGPYSWLVVSEAQWETEHLEYARVILANVQSAEGQDGGWVFVNPPGAHPMLTAWYAQRITQLWQQKRARETVRVVSPKAASMSPALWNLGCGSIARVMKQESLRGVLEEILPAATPDRILVKVTWHGYAAGTYTDPAALDLLLSALPAPAIILRATPPAAIWVEHNSIGKRRRKRIAPGFANKKRNISGEPDWQMSWLAIARNIVNVSEVFGTKSMRAMQRASFRKLCWSSADAR